MSKWKETMTKKKPQYKLKEELLTEEVSEDTPDVKNVEESEPVPKKPQKVKLKGVTFINLRSGPDMRSRVRYLASAEADFILLSEEGKWSQIQEIGHINRTGYLLSNLLRKVK